MTSRGTALDAHTLAAAAESAYGGYLRDLRSLVSLDCGTGHLPGLAAATDLVVDRLRGLGFDVRCTPVTGARAEPLGDLVVARLRGSVPTGPRILLLGHLDTVFDVGTAAARPFRVAGERAYGPGVSDDKGGLLGGLLAIRALSTVGFAAYGELVVVLTPDEEIGSPGSREHLQAVARDCDACFSLECAREDGSLVAARKGVADVVLRVSGQAAHAGIEPERGVDAAAAAAHLLLAIRELNGRWPGVSVNVGVVRAGTRPNVVADTAELQIDVRARDVVGFDAVRAEIARLAAQEWVRGARVSYAEGTVTPPMERTAPTSSLVACAQEVARDLGLDVAAVATGGVADANYVAALGVPTLDGLGPVGGGDHSPGEWLALDTVVPRAALLAGLIARTATSCPEALPEP